jgi:hypothetical protein
MLRKEVFSDFFEILLGCCLHSYNDVLLNVHFEVQACLYCCHCIMAGVVDTGGIVVTSDKLIAGVMKSMKIRAVHQ